MFSPNTNDVIRKFDRDTRRLATAVVGAVVFAGLILALPIQEHYQNSAPQTGEAVGPLLHTGVSTLAKNLVLTGKSSTDEMAPGQASSGDPAFTKMSRQENPSFQMEAAGSMSCYSGYAVSIVKIEGRKERREPRDLAAGIEGS